MTDEQMAAIRQAIFVKLPIDRADDVATLLARADVIARWISTGELPQKPDEPNSFAEAAQMRGQGFGSWPGPDSAR